MPFCAQPILARSASGTSPGSSGSNRHLRLQGSVANRTSTPFSPDRPECWLCCGELRCVGGHPPSWPRSLQASRRSRIPSDRVHSYPSGDGIEPLRPQWNSYARDPCACCRMGKGTSRDSRTWAYCGQSRPRMPQHRPKPSASESLLLAHRMPFLSPNGLRRESLDSQPKQ